MRRSYETADSQAIWAKQFVGTAFSIAMLITLAGCGSDDSTPTGERQPDPTPRQITIAGTAAGGIFDPGPAIGGDSSLWMNYSEVDAHPDDARLPVVNSRLAKSLDGGLSWDDIGAVNLREPITLPAPNDAIPAAWIHEVARLAYDEYAPAGTEWKLIWHRYLTIYNGAKLRLFEHGWMGLRSAPSPEGPWSDERKLFTGLGYDTANDVTIGAPEFPLHNVFPAASDLGEIVLYTEPALLVRPEGIYVAMLGATMDSGKIVLLRCSHDFSSVEYLGAFLDGSEAAQFGAEFDGFSAPEFAETDSATYLMVTLTEPPGGLYRGCLVFEIESLADATVVRQGGDPVVIESVFGDAGSFNGACGYLPTGILYSQYFPGEDPEFRIFDSGKTLQ